MLVKVTLDYFDFHDGTNARATVWVDSTKLPEGCPCALPHPSTYKKDIKFWWERDVAVIPAAAMLALGAWTPEPGLLIADRVRQDR